MTGAGEQPRAHGDYSRAQPAGARRSLSVDGSAGVPRLTCSVQQAQIIRPRHGENNRGRRGPGRDEFRVRLHVLRLESSRVRPSSRTVREQGRDDEISSQAAPDLSDSQQ